MLFLSAAVDCTVLRIAGDRVVSKTMHLEIIANQLTGLVLCIYKLHEIVLFFLLPFVAKLYLCFFSVPPQNVTVLVYPSENVKEGENITIVCSTYSNPPSQMILKKVNQEKEIILPVVNGTFTLYNVTKNDTGRYLLDVFNEVGNNIKVIEIAVVGR